jgi:hypothetical protein
MPTHASSSMAISPRASTIRRNTVPALRNVQTPRDSAPLAGCQVGDQEASRIARLNELRRSGHVRLWVRGTPLQELLSLAITVSIT